MVLTDTVRRNGVSSIEAEATLSVIGDRLTDEASVKYVAFHDDPDTTRVIVGLERGGIHASKLPEKMEVAYVKPEDNQVILHY